jgi:hypothetical protein
MYTALTQDTNTVFINQLLTSRFQKGAYYVGIRIFNGLLSDLKGFMNENAQFKIALKRYLNTHSFYSVDEYLLCIK